MNVNVKCNGIVNDDFKLGYLFHFGYRYATFIAPSYLSQGLLTFLSIDTPQTIWSKISQKYRIPDYHIVLSISCSFIGANIIVIITYHQNFFTRHASSSNSYYLHDCCMQSVFILLYDQRETRTSLSRGCYDINKQQTHLLFDF